MAWCLECDPSCPGSTPTAPHCSWSDRTLAGRQLATLCLTRKAMEERWAGQVPHSLVPKERRKTFHQLPKQPSRSPIMGIHLLRYPRASVSAGRPLCWLICGLHSTGQGKVLGLPGRRGWLHRTVLRYMGYSSKQNLRLPSVWTS